MIAGGTYAVFAYTAGHARIAEYLQIPYVPGAGELAVFCGALAAAGLGFLWFNAYPGADVHGRRRLARRSARRSASSR